MIASSMNYQAQGHSDLSSKNNHYLNCLLLTVYIEIHKIFIIQRPHCCQQKVQICLVLAATPPHEGGGGGCRRRLYVAEVFV
jgi:hypothetical protein